MYYNCTCQKLIIIATIRFCHSNILCIIGYCKEVPGLVYPFMKQSLFNCIHEVSLRNLIYMKFIHVICIVTWLHTRLPRSAVRFCELESVIKNYDWSCKRALLSSSKFLVSQPKIERFYLYAQFDHIPSSSTLI